MLGDLVVLMTKTIGNGFAVIKPYTMYLLSTLLAIEIAWFGIKLMMGNESVSSSVIKLFTLGAYYFVIINFTDLAFMFEESLILLASKLGGNFDLTYFHNPDKIMIFAAEEILIPLKDYIDDSSTGKIWDMQFGRILMLGFAWIAVLCSFAMIAIQLVIAIIEFYIILFMALILAPFTIFEPTKFIGSKTFSAVVGQGISLGMIALVSGVSVNVYDQVLDFPPSASFSVGFVCVLITSSVVLFFLILNVKPLTSSLLSGVPNLSGNSFLSTASALGAAGFAGAKAIKSAPSQAMQSMKEKKDSAVKTFNTIARAGTATGNTLNKAKEGIGQVASRFKPNGATSGDISAGSKMSGEASSTPSSSKPPSNNFRPK